MQALIVFFYSTQRIFEDKILVFNKRFRHHIRKAERIRFKFFEHTKIIWDQCFAVTNPIFSANCLMINCLHLMHHVSAAGEPVSNRICNSARVIVTTGTVVRNCHVASTHCCRTLTDKHILVVGIIRMQIRGIYADDYQKNIKGKQ